MPDALVLGGGTMKGAFEVGVLSELLKTFSPSAIYGVSVGALNGAYLADWIGRARRAGQPADWPGAAASLEAFWRQNVTGFDALGERRAPASIVFNAITKNFNGFVSMGPLETLLGKTIDPDNIAASGVRFEAGTVNLVTGEFIGATAATPSFLKYLIGSAMSPLVMPLQQVVPNKVLLVDGGVRNVAPLKSAIQQGATDIVCVVCHPEKLSPAGVEPKNLFSVVDRLMDVITNEIVNEDLEWASYVNEFCPADGSPKPDEPFKGCRRVKVRVIRPEAELQIPLETFTKADIAELIALGKRTAIV